MFGLLSHLVPKDPRTYALWLALTFMVWLVFYLSGEPLRGVELVGAAVFCAALGVVVVSVWSRLRRPKASPPAKTSDGETETG